MGCVVPWLAQRAPFLLALPPPPAFLAAFVGALLARLVGAVLVALPLIRQRSRSTWIGYAVLASGVYALVGNLLLAPSGPPSNLLLNLLSNLAPVLLLGAFSHLGFRAYREAAPLHS